MSLFGLVYAKIVLVLIVLTIIINAKSVWPALKKHKLYLFLTLQYPIIHLLKINILDPPDLSLLSSLATFQEPWLWIFFIPLLTIPFFENVENVNRYIRISIPIVIIITFSFMLSKWFSHPEQRQVLFIKGLFDVPLFLSTLLIAYISMTKKYTLTGSLFMVILSFMVTVICFEFAKVRGISLALSIGLSTSLIYITYHSTKRLNGCIKIKNLIPLIILTTAGLIYLVMLFDDRLSLVLKELSNPNMVDSSTWIRLAMYKASLIEILKAPIFGHGIAYEKIIINNIQSRHIHTHNMYLTWLLWGGLISLASGMLFMFAAALAQKKSTAIKATLFLLPIAISQLFDSFLIWGQINQVFLIFSSMIYIAMIKLDGNDKNNTIVE